MAKRKPVLKAQKSSEIVAPQYVLRFDTEGQHGKTTLSFTSPTQLSFNLANEKLVVTSR